MHASIGTADGTLQPRWKTPGALARPMPRPYTVLDPVPYSVAYSAHYSVLYSALWRASPTNARCPPRHAMTAAASRRHPRAGVDVPNAGQIAGHGLWNPGQRPRRSIPSFAVANARQTRYRQMLTLCCMAHRLHRPAVSALAPAAPEARRVDPPGGAAAPAGPGVLPANPPPAAARARTQPAPIQPPIGPEATPSPRSSLADRPHDLARDLVSDPVSVPSARPAAEPDWVMAVPGNEWLHCRDRGRAAPHPLHASPSSCRWTLSPRLPANGGDRLLPLDLGPATPFRVAPPEPADWRFWLPHELAGGSPDSPGHCARSAPWPDPGNASSEPAGNRWPMHRHARPPRPSPRHAPAAS